MTHKGTQPLATDSLLLRRFTLDDAAPMFRNWASDPAVTRYLTWNVHPDVDFTYTLLKMWIVRYAEKGYYNWAIEVGGEAVGSISVVEASDANGYAEIGYCLSRVHWGKGLMTGALRLVLDYLLGEVGLHRIYLKHDAQNEASGRVMIKNGLVHEGTLREHCLRKDGTWADILVYSQLRQEWEEVHARS